MQHQAALREDGAHGVEIMDHAVVADVFHRNARRHQLAGIGIAFIPHRIEFGGMDNGRGKAGKFGGTQRRNAGIGEVRIVRQVVGEVRLQCDPVEQMIFGKRLARGRSVLEIENRADQALRRYRRPGVAECVMANHGGKRRTCGIAAESWNIRKIASPIFSSLSRATLSSAVAETTLR